MLEPAHAGSSRPRAFLRLGGATLARHQLALALATGCGRIVCIARVFEPELIELQHQAERAGARFHVISGSRALSGLIIASDEILVICDGLVPAPAEALALLDRAPAILALPAETAVPAGFERIDINHAAAGLMLIPGRLIERLNELPADVDATSSLLRIALQSGISLRLVPQALTDNSKWLLVHNEDQAHAAELHWMERHTTGLGRSPSAVLAALSVRRFGPALLHAGSGSRSLLFAALAFVALGAGAGWFGQVALGLGFCAPAWIFLQTAVIIEKIQLDSLGGKPPRLASDGPFGVLIDVTIAGLLVSAMPAVPGESWWYRGFAPVMLMAALRLVSRILRENWSAWLRDRLLLLLMLVGLALADVLGLGVPALAAALMLAGIIIPLAPVGITRP